MSNTKWTFKGSNMDAPLSQEEKRAKVKRLFDQTMAIHRMKTNKPKFNHVKAISVKEGEEE